MSNDTPRRPGRPPRETQTPPYDETMAETGPSHAGATQYDTLNGQPAVTEERKPVAPGEVTERLFPGEVRDTFYLSDEDKARFHTATSSDISDAIPTSLADTKLEGGRVYKTVRAPAHYGKWEPGHLRAKRLARPTMEVVLDEKGDPVYATFDTIFVVEDRVDYLKRLAMHNQKSEDFTRGLINGKVDAEEGSIENFKGSDPSYIQQQYRQARERLAGMKTKWPPHMSIEDIEKHMGDERTIAIERRAARNGRSERPGEYQAYEERMAEAAKKKGSKKTFSFPGQPAK